MSKFRRQLMMANLSEPVPPTPPLPYDAEIEYLESTGTQYINTGVEVAYEMPIEIKYGVSKAHAGNDIVFFGHYASNKGGYVFLTGSNKARHRWGSSTYKEIAVSVGDVLTFTVSSNHSVVNRNVTKSTQQSTTSGSSFFTNEGFQLFQVNAKGGSRIYSCKLGTLRDMIAVRVGTTGYLYDKVSGALFGNDGTGDFILGNDKN